MYEKEIEQLQEMIDESNRIVFFGGAGVSTESNIPDFRSATWNYIIRNISIHRNRWSVIAFLCKYPEAFYEFYKEKMMISGCEAKCCPSETGRIGSRPENCRLL